MPEKRTEEIIDGQLVSTIDGWYQMLAKDQDNVPQIYTLERHSTKTRPLPEGMDNPFITEAAPMRITPSRAKRVGRAVLRIGVIPDEQIGYRFDGEEYTPIHDEAAMSAARQMLKDMQPDVLVGVGDTIDMSEVSRYDPDSTHFGPHTLQRSIDRAARWDAELSADHPGAEKHRLAGNHDRLGKYVLKHALNMAGLRRGEAPDEWPVLSTPFLVRAEETGWEYHQGYPGAHWSPEDHPDIVFSHWDKVRSNGSTAAAMSEANPYNHQFGGHVHRHELHTRTTPEGKTYIAETFGTLARTDGWVPSHGNSVNDKGEVVPRRENWQQGIGEVAVFASGVVSSRFHPIIDGVGHYNEREYDGN